MLYLLLAGVGLTLLLVGALHIRLSPIARDTQQVKHATRAIADNWVDLSAGGSVVEEMRAAARRLSNAAVDFEAAVRRLDRVSRKVAEAADAVQDLAEEVADDA